MHAISHAVNSYAISTWQLCVKKDKLNRLAVFKRMTFLYTLTIFVIYANNACFALHSFE